LCAASRPAPPRSGNGYGGASPERIGTRRRS
jgi:hypothetical protein